MIILHSISKELGSGKSRKLVLNNISWEIAPRARFIILAHKGAGKSTLLQIIAGSTTPTSGWVQRKGSICVTPGLVQRFGMELTYRKMALVVSHLYNVNADEIVQFACRFAELEEWLNEPMTELPKEVRDRVNYALAYAIPFDFYLFDEGIGGNNDWFSERCQMAIELRGQSAGVILTTSSPKVAAGFRGQVAILHRGQLYFFPTVRQAIYTFKSLPDASEWQSADVGEDPDEA